MEALLGRRIASGKEHETSLTNRSSLAARIMSGWHCLASPLSTEISSCGMRAMTSWTPGSTYHVNPTNLNVPVRLKLVPVPVNRG